MIDMKCQALFSQKKWKQNKNVVQLWLALKGLSMFHLDLILYIIV